MTAIISGSRQPLYFRIPAKLFTYVFHPLFLPTYVFLWLVFRFPLEFPGITPETLMLRKIIVFIMTAFFPAFAIFLMGRLQMIESIFLRKERDRIGPYVITMIFYWWMWYLSRYFLDQPVVLKFFYFGIFITTILGLILNSFTKISMHAMGVGGVFIFVILTCIHYQFHLGTDIAVVTLITGLVCTSRLLLKHHTNFEIYLGLFVGVLSQLIAYKFMM